MNCILRQLLERNKLVNSNRYWFYPPYSMTSWIVVTYDDAIRFLRSTTEFNRYERSVASAWFLVNLTDAKKQAEALSVVSQCSNYKFRNWNDFRKWLKGFISRYEDKMKRVIPKMINHVINPPAE